MCTCICVCARACARSLVRALSEQGPGVVCEGLGLSRWLWLASLGAAVESIDSWALAVRRRGEGDYSLRWAQRRDSAQVQALAPSRLGV